MFIRLLLTSHSRRRAMKYWILFLIHVVLCDLGPHYHPKRFKFCRKNPNVYYCMPAIVDRPYELNCGFNLLHVHTNFNHQQKQEILNLINGFRQEFAKGQYTKGKTIPDVIKIVSLIAFSFLFLI